MTKTDTTEKEAIRIVLQELKDRLPSSQHTGFMPSDEVKEAMKIVAEYLK